MINRFKFSVSKENRIYNYCSFFSFLLLFPGFFFYNYSIAHGYVPAFLGGYFGVTAVSVLLPLTFSGCISLLNNTDRISGLFFLLMAWTFFVLAYNYALGQPNGWSYEMLEWSLSGVLFNIVCYLVARGLDFSQWSKYINPLFFLMVYVVLSNIGDLGIFYVKQDAHFSEAYVATYQGFARSLVVVSLLLISYYWKVSGLFYAILTCSMIAIFLNGARSEFVAFTLAVFLVTLVYCLSSRLTAIIYIVVVALVVFFVYNILDYLPDSRMIELINLGDSSSGIARSHFFEYGLKIIYDFPIMGWYGKYVNIGGVGAFPHNIFSAWVNLGLIGFIAYSALFLAMGIDVLRFFESYKFNGEFKAFLFFFFYVLILIIFSKDYTHMLIGFLVGLYSRYQLALRY